MEPFQLLLKPVSGACNLACTYCFYRAVPQLFPEKSLGPMSDDLLQVTIQKYLELGFRENIFVWQGGEPILAGRSFFERVIAYQKQFGHSQVVGNSIQTNALLIDESWARFFAQYKFFLGISIDGPQNLHDAARGAGSHAAVVRAINLLAKFRIEFNVLSVLHHNNVHAIGKMYKYLRTLPTAWFQFIPALDADPSSGDLLPHSLSSAEYGNALCQLFDLWVASDVGHVSLRNFDAILNAYLGLPSGLCTMDQTCGPYLVVENEGDVYPCDFFVRPQHRLGNILEDSFEDLMTRRRDTFEEVKGQLDPECEVCPWKILCFAGCPKDRTFVGNPSPSRTYFCEGYKQFYAHTFHWFARQSINIAHQQSLQPFFLKKLGEESPCLCGSGKELKNCLFNSQYD